MTSSWRKVIPRSFWSLGINIRAWLTHISVANKMRTGYNYQQFVEEISHVSYREALLCFKSHSWWRHQMETFSALLALCGGNSPVTGEFPTQRPVTRIFDVLFHLCLNKRLSKQSQGWWVETPSRWFWRHGNVHRRLRVSVDSWTGWVGRVAEQCVSNI